MNEVDRFIRQFKQYEQGGVLDDTFRRGFCYWFAYMLAGRFPGAVILYEPIEGHFVTDIDGQLYDIRGNVSPLYPSRDRLSREGEYLSHPSIVEGCILKTA